MPDASPQVPNDNQSYRSRSTRGVAAFFVAIAVLGSIGGIGTITAPHMRSTSQETAGILALVMTGVIAIVATRIALMGVIVKADGVVIRNWIRSPFFTWDEISGFRFGSELDLGLRETFASPVLATYVILKNGRHVPMVGISATRLKRKESHARVERILDTLESQRRRLGSADP